MKIKVTESQLTTYFNEVINEMDMCSCEEAVVLSEALTASDKSDIKSMVKKEIKDFLDINRSSDLDKKVEDIVKKKLAAMPVAAPVMPAPAVKPMMPKK